MMKTVCGATQQKIYCNYYKKFKIIPKIAKKKRQKIHKLIKKYFKIKLVFFFLIVSQSGGGGLCIFLINKK